MDVPQSATRVAWGGSATGSRSATLLPPSPVLPGLRTKVVRPRLPSDHVVRPRLTRLLDRGLGRRLILVSAPGGFGKTTLLSAWEPTGYLLAWISLDEGDADLRTFARGIIGAVQLQAQDHLDTTRSLLDHTVLPAPAVLAARFADELAELPDRIVIVLDDYHAIQDEQIHAFVARFVTRITPNVNLVISTREDPPLPIATLRARAELTEIRLEQLAFTTDELHTFFGNTLPAPLGAADADRLTERTEGWAAGMRLASLAMSDMPLGTGLTVDVEARGVQHAHDFIIDDILAAQPPPLQELLLRSSILDRFCAELLDALVGEPGAVMRGTEWIEALKRANLFITVLDTDGNWCRFHQLFRDALRRRLQARRSTEAVAALHHRASDWFARQGLIEDAIRHALAAGDPRQAALLVEENLHPLLDREGDLIRLDTWIRLLPADVADHYPAVLLARAWLLGLRDKPAEMAALLRGAEALLEEDTSRDAASREALLGTVDCLWSFVWATRFQGEPMLAASERAVQRVPLHWRSARGHTEFVHASALAMAGRNDEARAFLDACRATATHEDGVRISTALRGEARLHYLNLRNRDLSRTAREILDIGMAGRLIRTSAVGRLFSGLASYVRNDLYEARDHFQEMTLDRGRAGIPAAVDGAMGLALTLAALGDHDGSRATLIEMAMILDDVGSDGPFRLLQSCQARLALARGDIDEAGRHIRSIRDEVEAFPSFTEIPEITRARWLLLQGISSSLDEVTAIADGLRQQATIRRHSLGALRADLVQALLLQARGDTDGAIAVLQGAVALGRSGDVLRNFVDFGPPLQRLLVDLDRWTSPSDAYIARILAAFPATTGPLVAAAPSRREAKTPIVDALTWRELDILRLLDARMSNKEIARSLHISSETVKKHTSNIYQKLQVGSRREAVARVHSLGLLHVAREAATT